MKLIIQIACIFSFLAPTQKILEILVTNHILLVTTCKVKIL